MAELVKKDSMEACLLKECYELAALAARSEDTGMLLKAKAEGVDIADNYIPQVQGDTCPSTEMQVSSTILESLSNDIGRGGSPAKDLEMTQGLPPSGEKEFLLALIALRSGTDATHKLDAISHITEAQRYTPDDPRYIALSMLIAEGAE